MFTTFVSQPLPDSASEPGRSSTPERSRQKKRSQVARACDWCRVHREKCDSERPCSNCQSRGVRCNSSATLKAATLPNAYREIERLRQRVQELELELKAQKNTTSGDGSVIEQLSTPPTIPQNPSTPEKHDPETGDQALSRAGGQAKRPCDGIHLRTARSPQKTWYGSSSLFYFIGRINAFLTTAFEHDFSAQRLMPNSASTVLDAPTTVSEEESLNGDINTAVQEQQSIHAAEYLTAIQEEYFLNLLWQSYYTTNPIFDELEFKEHYRSLWPASGNERKPSALVDIVLALCIQYGVSQVQDANRALGGGAKHLAHNDATVAGRWYYRRCQMLLSSELESPSLSTMQCHILSNLYLCNASFMNMADHACSQSVRTAYMLGLHLEPPQSMPQRERELRKRVWWAVFNQDSKMSMKLGRPFLLYDSSTTCTAAAHDRETAALAGPGYSPPGEDVTWLTWNLYNTRLLLAARSAYTSFYNNVPSESSVCSGECGKLSEWANGVPSALKVKRQNDGESLSTDLTALEIEQFAPMWLQRQRLLLELLYHHLCTNLHRPSISFPSVPSPTTFPDGSARKCASHAMAVTHILHQVLLSTSILTGWLEAFQWQWNASMSLVGYILAYPRCDIAPAARNAVDISVAVFDKFGESFAVAVSAADIIRGLSGKLDELAVQRTGSEHDSLPQEPDTSSKANNNFDISVLNELQGFDGESTAEITGVWGQSIDILAAEPYSDINWLGANEAFPDQWEFTQPYVQGM
jgi:hypothetical protein